MLDFIVIFLIIVIGVPILLIFGTSLVLNSLLKKRFIPDEDYLKELSTSKFKMLTNSLLCIIMIVSLFVKFDFYIVIFTIAFSIKLIIDCILSLKHLKTKDSYDKNTYNFIKYKTIITFIVLIPIFIISLIILL